MFIDVYLQNQYISYREFFFQSKEFFPFHFLSERLLNVFPSHFVFA